MLKSGLGLLFSIRRKGWDTHVVLFLLGASVTDVAPPCPPHFIHLTPVFFLKKMKTCASHHGPVSGKSGKQTSHVITWPCSLKPAGLNRILQFGPK